MKPLPDDTAIDLEALRGMYMSGSATPSGVVDLVYRRIAAAGGKGVWIHLASRDEAMARARELESRGPSCGPLYGIPFAVKDNIDVAGAPTTTACPAYLRLPERSAFAVSALLEAGAIFIGKTNMDQFATGLVGTRTPYGSAANPFDARYIPGGSSSGSAVAVATGLASFALGTDTAGSGRVPAAFNNIVGLKPTRGLVSCAGVVPACRSLDCVSIFSLTVGDSLAVLRAMQGHDPEDPFSRRKENPVATAGPNPRWASGKFRFGVPAPSDLRFFGDPCAPGLYAQSLGRLAEMGGERVEVDYAPFREAAELLYGGAFVAERLEAGSELLEKDPEAIHPVVRGIMESAKRHTALDVFRAQARLRTLREKAEREWDKMDILALPTTGTIYSLAQIESDPVGLNANLGYYTNFVNLFDTCALALPAGFRPDGLPAGVTLVAGAMEDGPLCVLGARFQCLMGLPFGASAIRMRPNGPPPRDHAPETLA